MSLKRKIDGEFIPVAEGTELIPGDPGTVLTSGEDQTLVWTKPESKFRGEWSPDRLAWVSDFSSGIDNKPYITKRKGTGRSELPVIDPLVPTDKPYINSVFTGILTRGESSYFGIKLNELDLGNITRVSFSVRVKDAFGSIEENTRPAVLSDGILVWQDTTPSLVWGVESVVVPPNSELLEFGATADWGGSDSLGAYFTGISLYVTDQPYMLGEFVTYNGEMWKSLIDYNTQEPSKTSSSWSKALTLPPPYGTTEQRPNPVDVGIGFTYFDTTVNRPIWSTGSVWHNSDGTEI